MTDAAGTASADTSVLGIRRQEIEFVNQRRTKTNAQRKANSESERPALQPPTDPLQVVEAVGLALSGGGVRSAAVSLGVLQALNHHNVIRNIDYLSTVSGGGYMGSSFSATASATGGEFVFDRRRADPQVQRASEIKDTEAVQHIRNYSNYLIPGGMRDLVTAAAIVVRGLVANLSLVLPVILLLAAVTIHSNPNRSDLFVTNFFGYSLEKYVPVEHFGLTLAFSLAGLALFLIWALIRSFLPPGRQSEFRGWLPFLGASWLVLVFATFVFELQPFVIAGMFDAADQADPSRDALVALVTDWVKRLAAIATPIAAVVTFFRKQLGDLLKSTTAESSWSTKLLAVASKGLVWVAGAAVPLLIWIGFLYLSYWGIINDKPKAAAQAAACPPGVSGTVNVDRAASTCGGNIDIKLKLDGCSTCPAAPGAGAASPQAGSESDPETSHTPGWLLTAAKFVSKVINGYVIERPLWLLYVVVAVLLGLLSWLLKPNANSLHRLYRDRLSKAFLFDPTPPANPGSARGGPSRDQGRDFPPLDRLRMTELKPEFGPYHLINAALNIQGSDYANRRGRNADFFIFSPLFIGSEATEYARMEAFERVAPQLDLATAMAISGAAASSNMGSGTIRPLTPTLALLNVRLGYWLKNPRYVSSSTLNADGTRRAWIPEHKSTMYLWSEISGRLYENANEVYLTDGGHIENLGIYELLRRRCRIIIAVDAEADSAMHFPSFITLQRYARIDLGVRIDLPWQPISTTTLSQMAPPLATAKPAGSAASVTGPHVAIGKIDYGDGQYGYLVYVKSSLTGDENDYIRDYARRYRLFPHESTGDQFFSEEQFEVYRALGFHMMHGALCGADDVQVVGGREGTPLKFTAETDNEVVRQVHAALLG